MDARKEGRLAPERPEVAPSARDNLRAGGGVKANLATPPPLGAASAGHGPRAPFGRTLAPPPPPRAREDHRKGKKAG